MGIMLDSDENCSTVRNAKAAASTVHNVVLRPYLPGQQVLCTKGSRTGLNGDVRTYDGAGDV